MLKSTLPVGSPRLGAAANLRFRFPRSFCPELRISTDKVEQNLPSINAALLIPIIIVVAIAVPVFLSSRSNALKRTCQANLRTIDGAVQTYYAENEEYPTSIDELLPDFMKRNPTCPTSGDTYVLEPSSEPDSPPTVSCPGNEPGHSI